MSLRAFPISRAHPSRFKGAFLAAAVLSLTAGAGLARAAEPLLFTVPAEDGYGIEECMQSGSECGRVMANSWCQAHGHVKAVAFGSADDVTGSIPTPSKAASKMVQVAATDVVIRCGD